MNTLLIASLTACATFAACGPGKPELQNVGSDTMLEVAGAWAQAYTDVHKEIGISVQGGGSGTGIKDIIDGDCDIANSSRPMKAEEIASAKANGVTPVQHQVGHDGIAIFVHKDNPLQSVTLDQLKELFGDGGKLTKWSDLGVTLADAGADKIVLASRQNNSGTWECFRDAVLGSQGRFKLECNNLNGSKDVVEYCATTKSAIGYSGLAYATPAVRTVPVVRKVGGKPVMPSIDTILDGSYPIARPLFMYTKGEPQGAILHYLDWIKGDAGQKVLAAEGYVPMRKLQ